MNTIKDSLPNFSLYQELPTPIDRGVPFYVENNQLHDDVSQIPIFNNLNLSVMKDVI